MIDKLIVAVEYALLWIKVKWQRMMRGYSILDSMNACGYIDYILFGLLTELRDKGTTFPSNYKDREEFVAMLNEIIELLDEDEPMYNIEYNLSPTEFNAKNRKYYDEVYAWNNRRRKARLRVVEVFDYLSD